MFETVNTLYRRGSSASMDPENYRLNDRLSLESHYIRKAKSFYNYYIVGLVCLIGIFFYLVFCGSTLNDYTKTDSLRSGIFRAKNQALRRRDGFIMITPTLGRMELLPNFIRHYASTEDTSIKALILEWVDESSSPEPSFIDSLLYYPVPIYLIRPNTRSLNERFKPIEKLSQHSIIASNREANEYQRKYFTKAIFSVDDDILIPLSDLEHAFSLFTQPYQTITRMVGFFARKGSSEGEYITSYKPEYNIVLTKAAFLHHDWFYKYWEEKYLELREFVTINSNCEDILMSYIYADEVGIAPMFFLSKYKDLGLVKGISTKPSHYDFRSKCIEKFNYFFGETTLISTNIMIKNLDA